MSFVTRIAARTDLAQHFIWKHRDFEGGDSDPRYVCEGRARYTARSLKRDILGACQEVRPLVCWVRTQEHPILHAHSRLGFFASFIASLLTGTPLLIHLHALAKQPRLYRILWRLASARPIFNSNKTCRHYGCDPATSLVVMPPINWPKTAPQSRLDPIRFVACGAFVRGKCFDVLIRAFEGLSLPAGRAAELHIYGLHSDPTDPACQNQIVALAEKNPAIYLHPWDAGWADQLSAGDIFVHLGRPESFGMVTLEAFARGCRLVVLRDTFLDDLPPTLGTLGIYRADRPDFTLVAEQLKVAMEDNAVVATLWELRRPSSGLFSVGASRAKLARGYEEIRGNY